MVWMAAGVACAAMAVFAWGIFDASFEDEYAYIAQSYYADLFFAGRFHDPAWLEFPAYDLPPLPKYLIGLAFKVARLPMPQPSAAWAWYDHYGHFGTSLTLPVARVPIIFVGALGCVAIFACGVLVKDGRVGTIAALASYVQSALSPFGAPSHVGRADRGVHADRAGGLPMVVAAGLGRAIGGGHSRAPLLGRYLLRASDPLEVQRGFSGS